MLSLYRNIGLYIGLFSWVRLPWEEITLTQHKHVKSPWYTSSIAFLKDWNSSLCSRWYPQLFCTPLCGSICWMQEAGNMVLDARGREHGAGCKRQGRQRSLLGRREEGLKIMSPPQTWGWLYVSQTGILLTINTSAYIYTHICAHQHTLCMTKTHPGKNLFAPVSTRIYK